MVTKYDEGVNMSSNYETKEQPIGAQAKYLGIEGNREPAAGHLDQANTREGGSLARAISMVHRHNERGEHSPMVAGYKMHDGGMRDANCRAEHNDTTGTEGE